MIRHRAGIRFGYGHSDRYLVKAVTDYLINLCGSDVDELTLYEVAEMLLREDTDADRPLKTLQRGLERPPGEDPPATGAQTFRELSGLVVFHDARRARRNGQTVEFGGRNVAWKMFVLLCNRHPAYYPPSDLGHDACNEDWEGDDTGLNTLYNHISSELNRLVKPLGLKAKFARRAGYRLELVTS
jgi:hypothetical protein